MKVSNNKRNLVMSITGDVFNLIEGYDKTSGPNPTFLQAEPVAETPDPVTILNKIKNLENFIIIARNILGDNMPTLCYNLNSINGQNIGEKGSKIINDLLFRAYRKAIDNNNYNDIAALTISLYKYEGAFSWLGSIVEMDENGNPQKIRIEPYIVGGEPATPSNFIKFAERAQGKSVLDYFYDINSSDYNLASNLYNSLINNNNDPLTLEDFGKLYALFGLVLLKQKEDPNSSLIGFKQMNFQTLNMGNNFQFPPCDNN
jgi:hypothetical protein